MTSLLLIKPGHILKKENVQLKDVGPDLEGVNHYAQ
jgi:hypothetical protein